MKNFIFAAFCSITTLFYAETAFGGIIDNQTWTIASSCNPITTIEVANVLGQQVFQRTKDNLSNNKVSISYWTTGMYIVKSNNTTSHKLIVK